MHHLFSQNHADNLAPRTFAIKSRIFRHLPGNDFGKWSLETALEDNISAILGISLLGPKGRSQN